MARRKINTKNLKFVPISDVPEVIRKTQWDEILEKIPRGQALVLTEDEASPETVRSALRRCKSKSKFRQFQMTTRKIEGKRMIYILNPIPDGSLPVERKALITPPTVRQARLPSEKEIFEYITSKPQFAHTLGEVQERFFGRRLPRSDPEMRTMYFRLRERVLKVHGKIEREKRGKFESTMIGKEKRFTFEPIKISDWTEIQ